MRLPSPKSRLLHVTAIDDVATDQWLGRLLASGSVAKNASLTRLLDGGDKAKFANSLFAMECVIPQLGLTQPCTILTAFVITFTWYLGVITAESSRQVQPSLLGVLVGKYVRTESVEMS